MTNICARLRDDNNDATPSFLPTPFLLLDGDNFLLLDGEQFNLLELE
jgi:hypothetical protein